LSGEGGDETKGIAIFWMRFYVLLEN
jgi:hypothetical protein